MNVGDKIMVIEDSRPVFLTIEALSEHYRQGEIVLVEERRGYILKDECYTKKQIVGMFEEVNEDE